MGRIFVSGVSSIGNSNYHSSIEKLLLLREGTWFDVPIQNMDQTSNLSSKTRGAATPCTRIIWVSFLRFRRTFTEVIGSAEL